MAFHTHAHVVPATFRRRAPALTRQQNVNTHTHTANKLRNPHAPRAPPPQAPAHDATPNAHSCLQCSAVSGAFTAPGQGEASKDGQATASHLPGSRATRSKRTCGNTKGYMLVGQNYARIHSLSLMAGRPVNQLQVTAATPQSTPSTLEGWPMEAAGGRGRTPRPLRRWGCVWYSRSMCWVLHNPPGRGQRGRGAGLTFT